MFQKKNMEKQIKLFQAFGNKTRLPIIYALLSGPLTVTDICKKVKLEQSLVSHNLRFLEEQGLVVAWKFGNWRKYSLMREVAEPMLELSEEQVKGCGKRKIEKVEDF